MRKTRMQRGITLIALIITIIILLILAIVTIGSIKNSNIITYAQNAATDYNTKKNEEETIIAGYESLIESNLPGKNGGSKVTYTDGVPVPAGFKVVTGTKDTGLVIENETEGSQFVWVPVSNINTMVMCKNKTTSDQCSIELNEEKTALLCKTHNNSTDICGKLYGISGNLNRIEIGRTNQDYNTDSNKEPYNMSGETNTTYQTEFNEMAVSVAKNGGFYVGRYEVSKNGDKAQSKGSTKEVAVYSAINSKTSVNDWVGLYELCKTYNTSSVKSSMIWGSQFDAMLLWMEKEATEFDMNKRNTDPDKKTGSVPTDEIRNVYDLGGNYSEFTQEGQATTGRAIRGGNSEQSALLIDMRMITNQTNSNGYYTSRLALYIK